jgi:hypothetical protein
MRICSVTKEPGAFPVRKGAIDRFPVLLQTIKIENKRSNTITAFFQRKVTDFP